MLTSPLSKNAVISNRNCLSKTFDFEVASWSEIVLHSADQLMIKRCLDANEKKMCFYLTIVSFTVFFCFLLIKFCCVIGTADDFDGLFTVSLSGNFFPGLYLFEVSIAK